MLLLNIEHINTKKEISHKYSIIEFLDLKINCKNVYGVVVVEIICFIFNNFLIRIILNLFVGCNQIF